MLVCEGQSPWKTICECWPWPREQTCLTATNHIHRVEATHQVLWERKWNVSYWHTLLSLVFKDRGCRSGCAWTMNSNAWSSLRLWDRTNLSQSPLHKNKDDNRHLIVNWDCSPCQPGHLLKWPFRLLVRMWSKWTSIRIQVDGACRDLSSQSNKLMFLLIKLLVL
jgi:hypothetical protein